MRLVASPKEVMPNESPEPQQANRRVHRELLAFTQRHCTEVHVAAALEELGCAVDRLQENDVTHRDIAARGAEADLLLYTRTWGLPDPGAVIGVFRQLEARGVVTASFHLDLYLGLEREATLEGDPFWSTGLVLTPDGAPESEAEFAWRGIRHIWSPPAVHGPECRSGRFRPQMAHDVTFVGSYPYPHPEWPYRNQLVEWLSATYGSRFRRYGGGSTVVRNEPLNDLYASAKVVVGDSCNPRRPDGTFHPRYWCVDEETEVLTADGWKRYDAVAVGDLAYSIDPAGLGAWSPVEAVSIFPPAEREMLVVEGASHSSVSTLDHRWLTDRPVGRRREAIRAFRTSADLTSQDRVPICAPCSDLPLSPKFSDAFVELVAWAWTEGCVRRGRYEKIVQSNRANPAHVARIRAALTAEFGPPVAHLREAERGAPAWREVVYPARPEMTEFVLNSVASEAFEAVAPDHAVSAQFVAGLTGAQLRLFVETSVDGDGCRKGRSVTLAQAERRRLDAIEMAYALLGEATNVTLQGPVHILHVKRRSFVSPLRADASRRSVRRETREGIVWCPTTGNGTWLARRRGSVYFTGNSDRLTETLGRGGFLVWPRIEGVEELGFEDGVHFRLYDFGDLDGLRSIIDFYVGHPEAARSIAAQGQAFVAANHTYRHRMAALLDAAGLGPA